MIKLKYDSGSDTYYIDGDIGEEIFYNFQVKICYGYVTDFLFDDNFPQYNCVKINCRGLVYIVSTEKKKIPDIKRGIFLACIYGANIINEDDKLYKKIVKLFIKEDDFINFFYKGEEINITKSYIENVPLFTRSNLNNMVKSKVK